MGRNKSDFADDNISEKYISHKDYAMQNNKVTSDSINIEEPPSNDKLIEVSSSLKQSQNQFMLYDFNLLKLFG